MDKYAQLITSIKQKASLADYVSRYVKLQKKGDSYTGLCPFHHEKTPSFSVNDSKGFFYCFGCHASGDIFSFLQQINQESFSQVLKTLAADCGLELPEQNTQVMQTFIKQQNALKLFVEKAHKNLFSNEKVLEYLHGRGVTEESMKQFLLGYVDAKVLAVADPEFMQVLGLTKVIDKRILFPIFNRGSIVGYGARCLKGGSEVKYINSPESELFEKKKLLYGVEKKASDTLLVEGYLDAILVHQNTHYQAFASLGTAISVPQLEILWKKTSSPILCLDGDNAGLQAAKRACLLALEHISPSKNLDVCLLPKGEDPASMALFYKEEFDQQISNAKSMSQFLFDQACGKDLSEKSILNCKKEIQDNLNKIQDKAVRQVFKARWSAEFKNILQKMLPAKKAYKLPRTELHKNEIMLLSLLIKFPELLEDIGEDFALLEMPENLGVIQQNILNQAEPTEQMKKLVETSALPKTLEAAKKTWEEIYMLLAREKYKAEMAKLQQLFEQNFDEKIWKRIVELKKIINERNVIE